MNVTFKNYSFTAFLCLVLFSCTSSKQKTNIEGTSDIYVIETEFGDMKIKLYDSTPKHRDNFKKLVAFSTLFSICFITSAIASSRFRT